MNQEAIFNTIEGHRLQLIPFFLYLKQHLFFGFIQLEVQTELQLKLSCCFNIGCCL
jgi:hypothetical protein